MTERFRRTDRTGVIDLGGVDSRTHGLSSRPAHLIVMRGRPMELGRMLSLPTNAPITIGRDRSCDLTLSDQLVSGAHARILPQRAGGFVLADLGSTNGTRVDGKPATSNWSLRDGDRLSFGETILLYTEADEPELGYLRDPLTLMGSDHLTGLDAKRRFDEALDRALASARLIKAPLALLMLDIDGLGAITRQYGPQAGAECISRVGRIIGDHARALGHATRYGGDDFSAFFKQTGRARGIAIAAKIRAAVAGLTLTQGGVSLEPRLSIGVAVFPEDGDWVIDLIAAADRALYRAKTSGRNRVATR